MDWKPLKYTKKRLEANIRKIENIPESVVEAFKNHDKDFAHAERTVDELLAQEPKNVTATIYKVMLLTEKKKYKEALPYARFLTKEIPLIPKAWELRGMTELITGNTELARIAFMHAGHTSRGKAWPYCCIAMSYFLERNYEAGLYLLDEVLRGSEITDEGEKSLLVYVRALIEEKSGDVSSALTHLIELQMLGSDYLKAKASLKIHELASKQSENEGEN